MDVISRGLECHMYSLVRELGQGGCGKCYLVRSRKYSQQCFFACKTMPVLKMGDGEGQAYSELESLKQIAHPNIIQFYDHFIFEEILFLVLEYCEGGSLEDIIKLQGSVPLSLAPSYTNQILHALAYLHSRGIAHHDIKPANIFVDKLGRIKLADFGLASKNNQDQCTSYKGTILYMGPEVLSMKPYDGFKADMWALGVTLFHMVTGTFPFKGKTLEQLKVTQRSGFFDTTLIRNKEIQNIIRHCLQLNPQDRLSADHLSLMSVKTADHELQPLLPHLKVKTTVSNHEPLIVQKNMICAHKKRVRSLVAHF